MRFLRLRPWLKDMPPGQLKAYLATSPVVAAPTTAATAPPAAIRATVAAKEARPLEEATFTIRRNETSIKVKLVLAGRGTKRTSRRIK